MCHPCVRTGVTHLSGPYTPWGRGGTSPARRSRWRGARRGGGPSSSLAIGFSSSAAEASASTRRSPRAWAERVAVLIVVGGDLLAQPGLVDHLVGGGKRAAPQHVDAEVPLDEPGQRTDAGRYRPEAVLAVGAPRGRAALGARLEQIRLDLPDEGDARLGIDAPARLPYRARERVLAPLGRVEGMGVVQLAGHEIDAESRRVVPLVTAARQAQDASRGRSLVQPSQRPVDAPSHRSLGLLEIREWHHGAGWLGPERGVPPETHGGLPRSPGLVRRIQVGPAHQRAPCAQPEGKMLVAAPAVVCSRRCHSELSLRPPTAGWRGSESDRRRPRDPRAPCRRWRLGKRPSPSLAWRARADRRSSICRQRESDRWHS